MRVWKEMATVAPEADLDGDGEGDGIPAGAWCERKDGKHTGRIFYTAIPWWIRLLVGNARVFVRALYVYLFAHESLHITANKGNKALHHPWWHCCVLVGHRLRLWPGHVSPSAIRLGERLLAAQDGEVLES